MRPSETRVFVIVILFALAGKILAIANLGEHMHIDRIMIEAGLCLPLLIWSFGLRIGLWR